MSSPISVTKVTRTGETERLREHCTRCGKTCVLADMYEIRLGRQATQQYFCLACRPDL